MTVSLERCGALRLGCIRDSEAQLAGLCGAGNLRIFEDVDGIGCSEMSRRCWEWCVDGDVDWCMVLSDDVMGCRDLAAGVEAILRSKPDYIHSMMDWTKWSVEAADRGIRWLGSYGGAYGGVMCMRRLECLSMLRWFEHCLGVGEKWPWNADDYLVCAWAWHSRRKIICHVPTVFQHMDPSGSFLGHGNANRVCRRSLAPECSWYDVLPCSPSDDVLSTGASLPRSWIRKHLFV